MAEPRPKILVVDDEPKNRKLLEALLTPHGYSVLMAENGQEALEQVQTQQPDLILLDVMMPIMDGFEVCQILKDNAETRLIPVVIMTALGDVEDRIRGIQAGADDFLTKPVNRDELMARIHTSLRLKHTVEHKVSQLLNAQTHLSHFVPNAVRRSIEANPETPALEMQEQDVSVLFVDISDYTKLSDTSPPQQVKGLVEHYFSGFVDCIHANGGDITETAGDGMMAIFTAADPTIHARSAVRAALEILQRTEHLNAQRQANVEPIAVHIGINSGLALVGATKLEGLGGTHWTYTALGQMTNIAARIAALAQRGTVSYRSRNGSTCRGTFRSERDRQTAVKERQRGSTRPSSLGTSFVELCHEDIG